MKLYLVRHGETDANRVLLHGVDTPPHDGPMTFKTGDDTNVPLNPNGRKHAWDAAQNLPDDITRILASPLLRTRETAEIICKEKGIDKEIIAFREELREYHQGRLEGLSLEQKLAITGGEKEGSALLCTYDYTKYGGDSWKTIYRRVSALFDELRIQKGDACIVCVTSGGVIRMAYK
ncbi:MAG: histidine phosphatase family protein, partial [bacterium]|nr:histidine phosphatase family protein [bacterium]